MARMRSESLDSTPVASSGDRFIEIAADELARIKASEEGGQLVALVKQWYSFCKNARIGEERQWYKNLDMYQGRQFTVWDKNTNRMVEPTRLAHNVRIAVNIIEPIVRTEMAKTGAKTPTATVAAASSDMTDIMAARAGEAAWEWFYHEQKFQTRVFIPANFWRTITGIGFWKTYYAPTEVDPAAGDASRLRRRKEQQELQDPANSSQLDFLSQISRPEPPPEEPTLGRIKVDPVTPFHMFIPNLTETDFQSQPYVLHVYTKTIEQARMIYGDLLPEGWNPDPIAANAVLDISHLGVKGATTPMPDSVMVTEAWVKPGYTKMLPKGGLIIMVGDEIVSLHKEGLPYSHGNFPFSVIHGIETGRFYRKSVVESVTPIQNEINHTFSQIIKRKNLATSPQMFYDEGSVEPTRISTAPGQWIPVRLGFARPTAVPLVDLPSYVLDLMTRLKESLDDISGQHQISRAISPGADTAASALALLQETDDNFLATTSDSIDTGLEDSGRQYLSLVVQFWDDERLVKVVGSESGADARILKGSDVESGTDLRIESGSSLPSSKTARIAIIEGWVDKGIISREAGLQAMEGGTLGRVYKKIRIDIDQAQRENIDMRDFDPAQAMQFQQQQEMQMQQATMMAQQQPPQVDPMTGAPMSPQMPEPDLLFPIGWMDNDAVHIDEHKSYAKTDEYRNLDPSIQAAIEAHVKAHEARAMQQAIEQMLTQSAPTDQAPSPEMQAPIQ